MYTLVIKNIGPGYRRSRDLTDTLPSDVADSSEQRHDQWLDVSTNGQTASQRLATMRSQARQISGALDRRSVAATAPASVTNVASVTGAGA